MMAGDTPARPVRVRDAIFADARIADLQNARGFVETFYRTVYQGKQDEILNAIDAGIAAMEQYKAAEFALMRARHAIAEARTLAQADANKVGPQMAEAPIDLIMRLDEMSREYDGRE